MTDIKRIKLARSTVETSPSKKHLQLPILASTRSKDIPLLEKGNGDLTSKS